MDTRGSVSPIPMPHEAPGTARYLTQISLPGTQALLVHQLFNESLNGIRGIQFETHIGMSEPTLRKLFDEVDAWIDACEYDADGVIVIRNANGLPIGNFDRAYSASEIRALRNMAEIVMLDLGQDEFFTRTGFSLEEGKQLLDRLNSILLHPLHLDETSESVAH